MDINATIREAYNGQTVNKDYLGIDISRITGEDLPRYGSSPCFFLFREIGRTARDLYQTGHYRHLKVYPRGGYFDYIAKKEFNTLEEWVADCGQHMHDIVYGWNKFDGRESYIALPTLLNRIDPRRPEIDALTNFMAKLAMNELTLTKNVLILRDNKVETFDQFMTE